MGYTTDFEGEFKITPSLSERDFEFLKKFNDTRRMARSIEGFGVEGEFFVDGTGDFGQGRDASIIDYNRPPSTQPGLWCQWVPTDESTLAWDGGEKFYEYVEWLKYLIKNFFEPRQYTLNGEVEWSGEDPSDLGKIVVVDNDVTVLQGTITYG